MWLRTDKIYSTSALAGNSQPGTPLSISFYKQSMHCPLSQCKSNMKTTPTDMVNLSILLNRHKILSPGQALRKVKPQELHESK